MMVKKNHLHWLFSHFMQVPGTAQSIWMWPRTSLFSLSGLSLLSRPHFLFPFKLFQHKTSNLSLLPAQTVLPSKGLFLARCQCRYTGLFNLIHVLWMQNHLSELRDPLGPYQEHLLWISTCNLYSIRHYIVCEYHPRLKYKWFIYYFMCDKLLNQNKHFRNTLYFL